MPENTQNMNDSLHLRNPVSVTSERRLSRYFCSETVFNLSWNILTDTEINSLEKWLDCAPVHRKINEPEFRT